MISEKFILSTLKLAYSDRFGSLVVFHHTLKYKVFLMFPEIFHLHAEKTSHRSVYYVRVIDRDKLHVTIMALSL